MPSPLKLLALFFALLGGVKLTRTISGGFQSPPEWDYLCFYLYSMAAQAGLNFYSPEELKNIVLPVRPSLHFVNEIVQVAIPYPPPTLIIFYPLSWFTYQNGYLFWIAIQLAALIACLAMLSKELAPKISTPIALALVLVWPSTHTTFTYAQTNFAVLTFLLLSRRSNNSVASGLWLACGAFVKPFVAALFLFPFLKKEWKTLFGALIAPAVGFLSATLLFGAKSIPDFFLSSATGTRPKVIYTELINQSLLATVLRATDFDFTSQSPLLAPSFLVLGSMILICSAWLIYRSEPAQTDEAFSLNLLTALLLYPGTLEHYGVYFLIPLTVLLIKADRPIQTASVVFVVAALCSFRDGAMMFFALLSLWLLFAYRIRARRAPDTL